MEVTIENDVRKAREEELSGMNSNAINFISSGSGQRIFIAVRQNWFAKYDLGESTIAMLQRLVDITKT